ncbi:AAA family ATPase [Inhella proteolytica]|uniref:AAA family ATPase n=1 Tax=Inhella proteolytica TaxID=2795029 RepID=A0A931J3Z3_9BURK|nr:AAA family ATPase [Inhella proteolytica]MBH9577856.1 AAA family ATPase [Inhella proteolytica]
MSSPAQPSSLADRETLWTQFLQRWPLDKLAGMTLRDYNQAGEDDHFCRWLEKRTETLGSIWGGSSLKFGIYSRSSSATKEPSAQKGVMQDEHYGWYAKYGRTAEEAFAAIRALIVQTAQAARAGRLDEVEGIDLWPIVRRKIAFLYQDREHPCILPVYMAPLLRQVWPGPGEPPKDSVALYEGFMNRRGMQPVLAYGDAIWAQVEAAQANVTPTDSDEWEQSELDATSTKGTMPALNQILYGPPGTGKTFATVDAALAILDPGHLAQHHANRAALKARFDALMQQRRIRFVTFHQSFSYEDFVEGLRAQVNDEEQLEYQVEPGVFKQLCDDARTPVAVGSTPVRSNARFWKISIDGTGTSPTRAYCLSHDEARIGWGKTGDLQLLDSGNEYYNSLGTSNRGTLRYFADEVAVGDVMLCIHSADAIAAVGVVTGEYRFEAPSQVPNGLKADYQHVRPVKWLYKGLTLPIGPLNDGAGFVQKTVYRLPRLNWPDLLAHLESHGYQSADGQAPAATSSASPYVLLIDEINRGNISRIFGELITLIEPSKRAGASEALEVVLPYSKRPFSVPQNVYLIGTMNTADRSLTAMDVALRRRFVFKAMPPRPELLEGLEVEGVPVDRLLAVMNQRIEALLDRDHCLGHAYFMPLQQEPTLGRLAEVFRNQVLPLLQEYFFDDWQRIQWVLNDHRKPAAFRFVSGQAVDVEALFGSDVNVARSPTAWSVNAAAFGHAESYLGVIDHAGVLDAE